MVSPIYLIALPLAAAFFISFFDKLGRWLSMLLFYTGIAAVTALSGYWLYVSAVTGSGSVVYTAGFAPPLSIALRLGLKRPFSSHSRTWQLWERRLCWETGSAGSPSRPWSFFCW